MPASAARVNVVAPPIHSTRSFRALCAKPARRRAFRAGWVAEWFKAAVLKRGGRFPYTPRRNRFTPPQPFDRYRPGRLAPIQTVSMVAKMVAGVRAGWRLVHLLPVILDNTLDNLATVIGVAMGMLYGFSGSAGRKDPSSRLQPARQELFVLSGVSGLAVLNGFVSGLTPQEHLAVLAAYVTATLAAAAATVAVVGILVIIDAELWRGRQDGLRGRALQLLMEYLLYGHDTPPFEESLNRRLGERIPRRWAKSERS